MIRNDALIADDVLKCLLMMVTPRTNNDQHTMVIDTIINAGVLSDLCNKITLLQKEYQLLCVRVIALTINHASELSERHIEELLPMLAHMFRLNQEELKFELAKCLGLLIQR